MAIKKYLSLLAIIFMCTWHVCGFQQDQLAYVENHSRTRESVKFKRLESGHQADRYIGNNIDDVFYILATEYIDLISADLTGIWLLDAQLPGALFIGANLLGANLQRADLHGANFQSANLEGAECRGANFQGADFHKANLQWAMLQKADLRGANLCGVNLDLANLHGAFIDRRTQGNITLLKHLGATYVDDAQICAVESIVVNNLGGLVNSSTGRSAPSPVFNRISSTQSIELPLLLHDS